MSSKRISVDVGFDRIGRSNNQSRSCAVPTDEGVHQNQGCRKRYDAVPVMMMTCLR